MQRVFVQTPQAFNAPQPELDCCFCFVIIVKLLFKCSFKNKEARGGGGIGGGGRGANYRDNSHTGFVFILEGFCLFACVVRACVRACVRAYVSVLTIMLCVWILHSAMLKIPTGVLSLRL